jgi:hypothetical protein
MIDGKRKETEITLLEENPLFYSAGDELLLEVFSFHYLKLVDLSIRFGNFLLR